MENQSTAPFKAARAIFAKATLERQRSLPGANQEAVEDMIDPLFEGMLSAAVTSLDDVATEAEVVVGDYGEANCIPTRMVEALIADLRGLTTSSVVD